MASRWKRPTTVLVAVLLFVPLPAFAGVVSGELKKWHAVTIDFPGPHHHELDSAPNPFLDYRLQVAMTAPSGRVYTVPGFFDGDGNGGAMGSVWRVRFAPDEQGMWSYQASFRAGPGVSVSLDAAAGTPTSFNGEGGTFTVQGTDANAPGFLRHGRLESIGDFYFKFRDGGYWVKAGMNNPENLLGYKGFDNTPYAWHAFAAHVIHWNPGDPNWDSPDNPGADDGKGIIGALNYLADQGLNSIYFMPMNIGADAMDTWPYADVAINRVGSTTNDNSHFDISKLRQWGIVLDHAQRKGLLLHVVLGDKTAANKHELDNATLGVERKLFYRELIARFGHHNALQWNISEEYNLDLPLDPNLIKQFAQYIRDVDPYDHPVTVHPHGNTYKEALAPFLGDDRFGVLSVQTWQRPEDVGLAIEYFRQATTGAGQPIPTNVDEHIGMNQISAADYRKRIIWDALFSGGGLELFKSFDDSDLDDFTVYEAYIRYARYARRFVEEHLPFWQMSPADHLVADENTLHGGAEVFVKPGQLYAVFLPNASPAPTLSMGSATGMFEKRWFNPRTGQFEGTPLTFAAAPTINLGTPPSSSQEDWVLLIRAVNPSNVPPQTADQSVNASSATPVGMALAYSDADGPGPYTFTVVTPPQHGTLSPVAPDGSVTYTPTAGFTGIDVFDWRVHDGVDSSETATVTILVSDTVLLFDDSFDRTSGSIVGNGWIEREASGGTVGLASGGLQFTQASDLASRPMVYRVFSRAAAGALEWEFLFNWSRTGSEGTYRLFMQLGDGALMSDGSWDAGIGVNLIWTAIGGVHEMLGYRRGGTTVGLAGVKGLARIKVNVDLAARTYAVSVNDVVVGQNIPFDQGIGGLDTMRFFTDALNEANFAGRLFDDVRLHLAGASTNQPPVALDQTVATDLNTSTTIQLQATDADNDSLQYIIVSTPANGSLLSNDGDSTIIYVPDTSFTGIDTFTFKANDGTVDSNVAALTISVDGGNVPPAVQDQGVVTPAATAVAILLAYSDPDGPGPYTFTVLTPPQHGSLSAPEPDGSLTYTPAAGFTGTDTFVWRVHDGADTSDTATVTISVGNAVVVLADDFDRASSSIVGNGWVEREASGASVGVAGNALEFSQATDQINRPMVYHTFPRSSGGTLEWEFQFNWRRTGQERTYRLFMQLGDSGLMSDGSWNSGIGVNLIWTSIGGAHESLGYLQSGSPVALAGVSGSTQISVTVDLTGRTYAVAVNGVVIGQGIAFTQAVDALDTVRFFVDALAAANFDGRSFDSVVIRAAP